MAIRREIRGPGELGVIRRELGVIRKPKPFEAWKTVEVKAPDSVKLDTGEYVSKSAFEELSPTHQAYLKKRGVEAFNIEQKELAEVSEKAYEEAVSYAEGEEEEQVKWREENIVEVGPAKEPVLRTQLEALTPEQQELLTRVGIEQFNIEQERLVEVSEGLGIEQQTAIATLEDYKIPVPPETLFYEIVKAGQFTLPELMAMKEAGFAGWDIKKYIADNPEVGKATLLTAGFTQIQIDEALKPPEPLGIEYAGYTAGQTQVTSMLSEDYIPTLEEYRALNPKMTSGGLIGSYEEKYGDIKGASAVTLGVKSYPGGKSVWEYEKIPTSLATKPPELPEPELTELEFYTQYYKDQGWDIEDILLVRPDKAPTPLLSPERLKARTAYHKEAEQAWRTYSGAPVISHETYVAHYLQALEEKGIEPTEDMRIKASQLYYRTYGAKAAVPSQVTGMVARAGFPAVRAAYPEVEMEDIKWYEHLITAVNVAAITSPAWLPPIARVVSKFIPKGAAVTTTQIASAADDVVKWGNDLRLATRALDAAKVGTPAYTQALQTVRHLNLQYSAASAALEGLISRVPLTTELVQAIPALQGVTDVRFALLRQAGGKVVIPNYAMPPVIEPSPPLVHPSWMTQDYDAWTGLYSASRPSNLIGYSGGYPAYEGGLIRMPQVVIYRMPIEVSPIGTVLGAQHTGEKVIFNFSTVEPQLAPPRGGGVAVHELTKTTPIEFEIVYPITSGGKVTTTPILVPWETTPLSPTVIFPFSPQTTPFLAPIIIPITPGTLTDEQLAGIEPLTPGQFESVIGVTGLTQAQINVAAEARTLTQILSVPAEVLEVVSEETTRAAMEAYNKAITEGVTVTEAEMAAQTAAQSAIQAATRQAIGTAIAGVTEAATQTAIQTAVQTAVEVATQTLVKTAVEEAAKVEAVEPVETVTPTPTPTPVITIIPPLLPLPILGERDAGDKRVALAPGKVFWKERDRWLSVSSPWRQSDVTVSPTPPPEAKMLEGTPQQTLVFIGEIPWKAMSVDYGDLDIYLDSQSRQIISEGRGAETDIGTRLPSTMEGISIPAVYEGMPEEDFLKTTTIMSVPMIAQSLTNLPEPEQERLISYLNPTAQKMVRTELSKAVIPGEEEVLEEVIETPEEPPTGLPVVTPPTATITLKPRKGRREQFTVEDLEGGVTFRQGLTWLVKLAPLETSKVYTTDAPPPGVYRLDVGKPRETVIALNQGKEPPAGEFTIPWGMFNIHYKDGLLTYPYSDKYKGPRGVVGSLAFEGQKKEPIVKALPAVKSVGIKEK